MSQSQIGRLCQYFVEICKKNGKLFVKMTIFCQNCLTFHVVIAVTTMLQGTKANQKVRKNVFYALQYQIRLLEGIHYRKNKKNTRHTNTARSASLCQYGGGISLRSAPSVFYFVT